MRIDPALRALRSDPASQRNAQAAMEEARDEWLGSPDMSRVMRDLAAFGSGADLSDCATLENLMADMAVAQSAIGNLTRRMDAALREYPLAQVPFRHQYSGGICVLQLAISGRAILSLVTYEDRFAQSGEGAQTVCFSDGERHEVYLAGSGEADLFEMLSVEGKRAVLDRRPRSLSQGSTLSLIGPRETKLLRNVDGRLVMLRLSRSTESPAPSREYRISDGELVHEASGDRRESREEMAIALLGCMGRTDAAAALSRIAFEGSDHLRWQALRTCLSLDTARGFATLSTLAREERDALSAIAGSLRAQLLESYPELAKVEAAPCRV